MDGDGLLARREEVRQLRARRANAVVDGSADVDVGYAPRASAVERYDREG